MGPFSVYGNISLNSNELADILYIVHLEKYYNEFVFRNIIKNMVIFYRIFLSIIFQF